MRNDYGWYMVAVSALLLLLTIGPTSYAFGLFVLPVSQDFGLSRADVNTGLIIMNFGMAGLAPFVGRLLDRWSVRRTLSLSAALFVGGLLVLAFSRNLWLSAAMLAGPVAAGVLGAGTVSTTALIARWFIVQRARAMAIAAIGISLSSILAVPAIGLLIAELGWRQGLAVEAVVIGVLFACVLPFVREPAAVAEVSSGSRAPGAAPVLPLTTGQLLRMPPFWTISLSLGLGFGVLQTIVVSLAPFGQEGGLTITQAASLISVYGGMAVAGKLVLAWVGDRIDRTLLLTALFALVGLTCAVPLFSHGYAAMLVCSALFGTIAGATTPAFGALLADKFGTASIGTAYGLASTVIAVISAACIRFGGEAYDRTGSYDLMFLSFSAIAGAAAVLMFLTSVVARAAGSSEVAAKATG
jgi:predicted MFS family arabinose efflux permease